MGRNMTVVKQVSGTEMVNAYFTMVRSDISKSVASLRVQDKDIFAQTCDNLVSSSFIAITAMRAYNSGVDCKDLEARLAEMMKTKALVINRMSKEIAIVQSYIDAQPKDEDE